MRLLILALLLAWQVDHNAEGLKALEAREYEAAVQHFTKAAEADPDDYSAHFNLGLAYSLMGKDAEAAEKYRKVLELKPGLYQAELNLGIVLLREKKTAEAVPHLESAARAKPNESRPQLYLGDALFDAGEFARAEQAYQAALTADANSAAAEAGLARSLVRQNRLGEAEPHFRRAIDLDPTLRDSILELAEGYEKAGQTDEAVKIYNLFPENAAARERLGMLLLKAGRAREALPHFEWAVAHSPTTANRVALARAYRQAGDVERALAAMAAAVEADAGNIDLRMAYGRELRDARKFAAAAAQFYRVTQARPDSVEAWSEFAAMLVSLEHFPDAIAALDKVRALGGETPGHVYLRAIVLDRIRDLKGALAAYDQFLATSQGRYPNEEFKARQRARIIKKELEKR